MEDTVPEFKVLHTTAPATSAQMRVLRDVFGSTLTGLTRGAADELIKNELTRIGWPMGQKPNWQRVKVLVEGSSNLPAKAKAFQLAQEGLVAFQRQRNPDEMAQANDIRIVFNEQLDARLDEFFRSKGMPFKLTANELRIKPDSWGQVIDAYSTVANVLRQNNVHAKMRVEED